MAGNRTPYTSREDRRKHLEANARNRGLPEGSLLEYDFDRKSMKKGVLKKMRKASKRIAKGKDSSKKR